MESLGAEHRQSHYQSRLLAYVIGVSFGSVAFGYASAIIATTLGKYSTHTKCSPYRYACTDCVLSR